MEEFDKNKKYCGSGWMTNIVPSRWWKADINHTCYLHDKGYEDPDSRTKNDKNFLKRMVDDTNEAYGSKNPMRYVCYILAFVYFIGVRLFGWIFHTSK